MAGESQAVDRIVISFEADVSRRQMGGFSEA